MTLKLQRPNNLEMRVWGRRARKWISDCGCYQILGRRRPKLEAAKR